MKNIKNLKISKKVKALVGAIILTTNLTGCAFKLNDTKETYVIEDSVLDTKNLQYFVINENGKGKIVPITSLKLVNSKNEVVESVDGIIIDGKIMNISNPVEIKFSLDVDNVIIDNELLPVSEFTLINSENGQKLTNIVGMFVNDEYVDLSENPLFNNNLLTTENFNLLVDEIYNDYVVVNKLDVTKDEVRDYIMVVNMDKLATDNKDLIVTIIGERKTDEVIQNAFKVYSAVMTENNDRYCMQGLGFDKIITVSNTVFDKDEKETVIEIEKRVAEIVKAGDNKEEFNKLLNKLLMEICDAENDKFNMESGVGYSTMNILMNFIRINFLNDLDKTNADLIKYFIVYAGDGVKYEENALSTGYYRGINNLMTDCLEIEAPVKTR